MNVNPLDWASSSLRLVARLFSSGVNSTTPVTAISEAPVGVANADIALVAKGTGATLAQVPDGTRSGGDKRGIYATDLQKFRTGSTYVASGSYSFIGGGQNNIANGNYSVICGGQDHIYGTTFNTFLGGGYNNRTTGSYAALVGGASNTASSSHSFVGGGQSNTAQTNTHATVCGGSGNTASGLYSFVGGGLSNVASGSRSSIAGGDTCTASAIYATVCGGWQNTSDGNSSFATGKRSTARGIESNFVFGGASLPDLGNSQASFLVLGVATTGATATVLTSNQSTASTTNQVVLPNNSAYSFSGEVIAGVTGGGDTARWTINGAIKRGANAASTTMVGTATVTMTHNDAGAAAWVVAVTADTTNGGIKVEVTGAAATTIRWVCKINTTEMTF